MTNFAEYKNVWVFAEQRQGKLMNVALELVGEGHKLAREISEDVYKRQTQTIPNWNCSFLFRDRAQS